MKILLLGGTGAMGIHLANILAARGDEVVVTSRRQRPGRDGVKFIQGNAQTREFLETVLEGGWDSVVDFMVRPSRGFSDVAKTIMRSTRQYVFVSSYRVYANSPVLVEGSPRLLDVSEDKEYLSTDEYALAKARCEDVLAFSGFGNWTVVRPGITFDGSGRFQLGTLELGVWLFRALNGLEVLFPTEMLSKTTTLTWGGDVACMMAGLIGNSLALGEAYTASTSESLTWSEVAEVYRRSIGLRLVECSLDQYERVAGGHYQISLDRMFDRRIDNSKIIDASGVSPSGIIPVRERLSSELERFVGSGVIPRGEIVRNARMDKALGCFGSLRPLLQTRPGVKTAAGYAVRRLF